jgi:hypothetical protein
MGEVQKHIGALLYHKETGSGVRSEFLKNAGKILLVF